MNQSIVSLSGYHGTSSVHRKSIEELGFDPEKTLERKDHWLGQGVYFFLDQEQAKWWAGNAVAKLRNTQSFQLVYQSDIQVERERYLDLDNNLELEKFITAAIALSRSSEGQYQDGKVPIFDEAKFRGVYFDYYKAENNISVIRRTFSKNAVRYCGAIRSESDLELQRKFLDAMGISFGETQICVSDKACITQTCLVYNEEEEVI